MTIPLTGTGGLFTRVGRMGGWLNSINTYRGLSGTAGTNVSNIFAQFATTDQIVIDRLWSQLTALQNSMSAAAAYIQGLAQATVIQMVTDDTNLDKVTLTSACQELIRQMRVSGALVAQPTVSATVTTGNGVVSNNGTGVVIATVLDATHTQADYAYNETIVGVCTNDSQQVSKPATLGQEPFLFTGTTLPDSPLDFTYPIGSGASLTVNAVSASQYSSQTTNLLTNGDFATLSAGLIGDWPIAVGAGTISAATGGNIFRVGTVQVACDGVTNTSFSQAFATAGQTNTQLAPLSIYALNVWLKADNGMAAGVLEIALINQGSGAILQDFGGNNLSLTINLSSLTTSFVAHNVFFRTPAALPPTAALRIRLTTPGTSGKNLYIADVVLTPAVQLYAGGPFIGLFSGATEFIATPVEGSSTGPDQFNVAVSNNYSSKWQELADRLWDLKDMSPPLILPSTPTSGSVTINDSLIT